MRTFDSEGVEHESHVVVAGVFGIGGTKAFCDLPPALQPVFGQCIDVDLDRDILAATFGTGGGKMSRRHKG